MKKNKIYEKNGITIITVVIIVVAAIILVTIPTVIIVSLINKNMSSTESEIDAETSFVTTATNEVLKKEKINKEDLQTALNNQKKDVAIVEEDVDTYIVIFKDSQREYEITKKRKCERSNNKNNR